MPFEQNRKPFEPNQRLILFLYKNPKGYFVFYFGKGIIINDTVIGLPGAYYGMPLSEVLKIVENCKYRTGPAFVANETELKELREYVQKYGPGPMEGMEEYMPPMNKSETLTSLKESKKDFIEMGYNKTELEKVLKEILG